MTKRKKREKRVYFIYDGRASGDQGTDDALVLMTCESKAEARRNMPDYGQCACYSYRREGNRLVDERWEFDFWPKPINWGD